MLIIINFQPNYRGSFFKRMVTLNRSDKTQMLKTGIFHSFLRKSLKTPPLPQVLPHFLPHFQDNFCLTRVILSPVCPRCQRCKVLHYWLLRFNLFSPKVAFGTLYPSDRPQSAYSAQRQRSYIWSSVSQVLVPCIIVFGTLQPSFQPDFTSEHPGERFYFCTLLVNLIQLPGYLFH